MANKLYFAEETSTVWTDSTGDLAMTLANLATATGRIGARKDLGSGSRSQWYRWRAHVAGFATAPAVYDSIDIYLARSDGTNADGAIGTGDAALGSVNQLLQMLYIGSVVVRSTTTTDDCTTGGVIRIVDRYVSPVWYVNSLDNLENTANAHKFTLTPIPPELQ